MATSATSAVASPGYELDPVKPSITVGGEVPHGVAVDQASQDLYVTVMTTNLFTVAPGKIEQLDASGTPTAQSPFVTASEDYFTGVAVNPVTQDVYAYQAQISTPFGLAGVSKMSVFSSGGVEGSSFDPGKARGPQIGSDSAGRVYYPNDTSDTVQVFDSSGTLKETITCAGCAGGPFADPSSVALDSEDNLYVVDVGSGRVIKFKLSGGSYVYDSVLQSGENAAAVGVDPSSDDVFVGDLAGGYHIAAYDSSGTKFDDFGADLVGPPPFGLSYAVGQIAANATTHKLYVADSSGSKVWIFDRVASIPAPTATTEPASSVGQLEATLHAIVNPEAHGLTDCRFEYTNDADFQANGYANATSTPCPLEPTGTSDTPLSKRIESLNPDTKYDYRIVATGYGGTSEGADETFDTLPALAPTITTGSASAIEFTAARLGGTVNPEGGPISDCHFEYTNDADFQANGYANAVNAACSSTPRGAVDTPVFAQATGLSPGTGYDFRLVATNNSGTTGGADQAFTTLTETCATNPVLCPPPSAESTPPPPATGSPPPASVPAHRHRRCRRGFRKRKVHGKRRCVKVKKKHR